MKEICIVILNYMNFAETIQCVDSVLRQRECNFHIIVVDNGSDNESFMLLNKKYRYDSLISIIHANKNYGFAKGNNVGISYARRRYNAEYVLLLNSDTVLCDKLYLKKMIDADERGIGVIGSKIYLLSGKEQSNYYEYVDFPGTLYRYLNIWAAKSGWDKAEKYFQIKLKNFKPIRILHGCVLLLTPEFFNYYAGLYDRTFLYGEEILLFLACKKVGIKEKEIDNTYLIHKAGQSSKILYSNRNSIREKLTLKSYKYIVWESFKLFKKEIF